MFFQVSKQAVKWNCIVKCVSNMAIQTMNFSSPNRSSLHGVRQLHMKIQPSLKISFPVNLERYLLQFRSYTASSEKKLLEKGVSSSFSLDQFCLKPGKYMILLLLWQYSITKAPVTDINKPKMSHSVNINNHKHNCYSCKKA